MEKIRIDSLILRKPKKSDIANLLPLLNDKQIEEYVPCLFYRTITQTKNFIKLSLQKTYYKNNFCLLIQDLKTKEIHGIIDAYIYINCEDTVTISYALKESSRGKGIMHTALKAFITYLYNNSNAKYVFFTIREDNYSSLKVMEKLRIPFAHKNGNYISYSLSLHKKPSF